MRRNVTPLRYPGGKQRLAPFIAEVLAANEIRHGNYVEPYAGGAGVAMELLINGNVENVHLNDSCYPIYALWRSVIDTPEELCDRIRSASMTINEWRLRRDIVNKPSGHSQLDVGFSTLYLNRCNRSGVLNGGVIGGLKQEGDWKMDARFNRNDLIRRIEAISNFRANITFSNMDAERYILEYVGELPYNTLVYCDPPYYNKASRLYLDHYRPEDHERVAAVIQDNLNHRWVVSYDDVHEIHAYYGERQSFTYSLQYNAAKVYKGKEIFIFSDDLTIPSTSVLPYISTALPQLALLT